MVSKPCFAAHDSAGLVYFFILPSDQEQQEVKEKKSNKMFGSNFLLVLIKL